MSTGVTCLQRVDSSREASCLTVPKLQIDWRIRRHGINLIEGRVAATRKYDFLLELVRILGAGLE
jgi:hypothetical protein